LLGLFDQPSERILGAAALILIHPAADESKAAKAGLQLKVRPIALQDGSARSLLLQAIATAKSLNCEQVSVELPTGDVHADLLKAEGFEAVKTEELWQLEVRTVNQRLSRLKARLKLPDDWQIRPPTSEDLEAIRAMASHYQFRQPEAIQFAKNQSQQGVYFDQHLSTVVESKGKLMGTMLVKGSHGLNGHVDLRMVDPGFRTHSMQLNFLLLARSIEAGLNAGYQTTTLTVNTTRDKETRNFAQRGSGRLLQSVDLFRLSLEQR